MNRSWTSDQLNYLRKYFPTGDLDKIAFTLGKTRAAIKTKAKVLGLRREVNIKHKFTEAEDEFIIDNYATTFTSKIANALGVSKSSIYNRAALLGLKKDNEWLKTNACTQKFKEIAATFHFPKGHTPANKGKKMSADQYKKAAPTMFKKGNKPVNTKPVGTISLRKDKRTGITYKYIKIADSNWKEYHRYVWEKEIGPIPKGANIIFLDGNQSNCELSNLAMKTDKELMLTNSIQNYPQDLRIAMQSHGRLISKINKLTNHGQKQTK
jgi:hypothetical protein